MAAASPLRIDARLVLPVASVGHLLAQKISSWDDRTRPQDRLDIRALLGVATVDDLREAERALTLIQQRGGDRGRNLQADFARLQQEARE